MPLYKPDPNDSTKQVPVVNNRVLVGNVSAPAHSLVNRRPNQVVINQPGTYAFLYNTTSSLGVTISASATLSQFGNFITGAVVPGDADAGTPSVKLDINPVAWRQTNSAGTVGDITFVYRGKYVQDGGPQ